MTITVCDVCHGGGQNWAHQLWPGSPCRICAGVGRVNALGRPATDDEIRADKAMHLGLPIVPGVLLEDDEARVYVSRAVLRTVARWALGLCMVAAGAGVMYAEGQVQRQPGPGFAVGLALIVGAAFLVVRGREQ